MDDTGRHWLVGSHFDLFDAQKQAIAERGARDGVLSRDDLRDLCQAVLDHARRHERILRMSGISVH